MVDGPILRIPKEVREGGGSGAWVRAQCRTLCGSSSRCTPLAPGTAAALSAATSALTPLAQAPAPFLCASASGCPTQVPLGVGVGQDGCCLEPTIPLCLILRLAGNQSFGLGDPHCHLCIIILRTGLKHGNQTPGYIFLRSNRWEGPPTSLRSSLSPSNNDPPPHPLPRPVLWPMQRPGGSRSCART